MPRANERAAAQEPNSLSERRQLRVRRNPIQVRDLTGRTP